MSFSINNDKLIGIYLGVTDLLLLLSKRINYNLEYIQVQ